MSRILVFFTWKWSHINVKIDLKDFQEEVVSDRITFVDVIFPKSLYTKIVPSTFFLHLFKLCRVDQVPTKKFANFQTIRMLEKKKNVSFNLIEFVMENKLLQE